MRNRMKEAMRTLEERVNELIAKARWDHPDDCSFSFLDNLEDLHPYENELDEELDREASRIVSAMDQMALLHGEIGHWTPPEE